MSNICGIDPDKYGISPALCCWLKQGDRMVVGVISKGTNLSLASKWDAPLEQSNIGSKVGGTVAGAAQDLTGATTITTFSTTQIWGGNNPLKFNLVLELFAWDDAVAQVMQPIQWLQEFASPQVNGWSPIDLKAAVKNITGGDGGNALGRMPMRVTLNVGRKIIIPECVIESVSVPIDGEKDSNGNLIRAQVTLDIQTLVMLNRDAIGGIYAQNMAAGQATFNKSSSLSWEKKEEKK